MCLFPHAGGTIEIRVVPTHEALHQGFVHLNTCGPQLPESNTNGIICFIISYVLYKKCMYNFTTHFAINNEEFAMECACMHLCTCPVHSNLY